MLQTLEGLPHKAEWASLQGIIRVTRYRHPLKGDYILIRLPSIRFCISLLDETVEAFAKRTRNYWHVENKVHYVRYVTF